ncbi:MAG: hypothetical protein CVV49_11865 [Spirochaetae bacterium HGW-Spirochaetae-5]|nr:MAG: hypothetical protein CVV49_11865 [Spirochaetae bacterium HGW-Spirochaetae-5]
MIKMIILIMILASIPVIASEDCVGTSIKASVMLEDNKGNRIMATDLALWYNYNVYDVTLTPYTNIKTWFIQNGYVFYKNNPFRDVYFLGGKADWNNFGIDLNHYCSHSVCSGQEQWDSYNREKVKDSGTGIVVYKIASSQVTRATVSYLFESGDFSVFFAAGKTLETASYFLNTKFKYDLYLSEFIFSTSADLSYWTEDKRYIITAVEQISYKSVSLEVEYYKSSKLLGRYNHNHVYDENPIVEDAVMVSMMYKFN